MRFQFYKFIAITLINAFLINAFSVPELFALHAFDDVQETYAPLALDFKKQNRFWTDHRIGFFDGLITNNQTGGSKVDRRVSYGLAAGLETVIAPSLFFRFDGRGEVSTSKSVDRLAPETTAEKVQTVLRPKVALTYVTPAGLELYGGAKPVYRHDERETFTTSSGRYDTKKKKSVLVPLHLGLTRRLGFGAVGFYYQLSDRKKVMVERHTPSHDTLSVETEVVEPSFIGAYSRFNAGPAEWTLDAASFSAGEAGERSENGTVIKDDYLRVDLSGVFAGSYRVSAGHQTAKYSKSAYMDLDSIPVTAVRIEWIAVDGGNEFNVGFVGAFGRDAQSIPEMNAKYQFNAVTVILGVKGVL